MMGFGKTQLCRSNNIYRTKDGIVNHYWDKHALLLTLNETSGRDDNYAE